VQVVGGYAGSSKVNGAIPMFYLIEPWQCVVMVHGILHDVISGLHIGWFTLP
jgi:hypothetical protein